MSNAHATFLFRDGSKLYGEYAGTSDIMQTNMFDTVGEVVENWRKQEWRDCECPQTVLTECVAHTDYGGGFWWVGRCCLQCKTFIGPRDPFGEFVRITEGELPEATLAIWSS